MPKTKAPVAFDRNQVRRQIRDRRNAISADERRAAESRVAERLLAMASFRRARHVSIYFATDGECSLGTFMMRASGRNKHLYAPIIKDDYLRFALLRPSAKLRLNRFGIPEPSEGPYIDARSLDLVLTPLVAFNDCGDRLGMGGGYFDRQFHFLQQRTTWFRPKLIGVGFELQHVPSIKSESWDVRLRCAVTEERFRDFS